MTDPIDELQELYTKIDTLSKTALSLIAGVNTKKGFGTRYPNTPLPDHGYWGEYSPYPIDDWVEACGNNDTRLGYWSWVKSQINLHKEDDNGEMA